jgi:hypothetical protein
VQHDQDRHGGERMICPRCGIEQPRGVECANCGIVVAKWSTARTRGPQLKQAGIGALLVFLGLIVVFVVVLFKADFGNPVGRVEGSPPPPPEQLGPPPAEGGATSASEHVMEDFWSSGVLGLRNAAEDQQARRVAMLVWFHEEECAPCRAVEDGIFDDRDVSTWLAQNNRVRIDPGASPENQGIADKFGVTTIPTAFIVRSDGVRKPIAVFVGDTTAPRPAAEWLKEARSLAGR